MEHLQSLEKVEEPVAPMKRLRLALLSLSRRFTNYLASLNWSEISVRDGAFCKVHFDSYRFSNSRLYQTAQNQESHPGLIRLQLSGALSEGGISPKLGVLLHAIIQPRIDSSVNPATRDGSMLASEQNLRTRSSSCVELLSFLLLRHQTTHRRVLNSILRAATHHADPGQDQTAGTHDGASVDGERL